MNSIGDNWYRALGEQATGNHQDRIDNLTASAREREAKAEAEVDDLISNWIGEGVRNCIGRGNVIYGIGTYKFIIGTAAFQKLLAWAEEQDLSIYIDDAEHTTARGEKTDFDLLFVPKQCVS